MAVDLLAEIARDTHGHLYLIVAHHSQPAVSSRTEIVAGDIHLDVVDAFAATEAHNLPYFFRSVGDHAETFVVHVRLAFVAKASGDGDLRARSTDARAGKLTRIDGIAD